MKIEKISDNQIRCTLNKTDLASREIKISELAYGTEKAKSLFRDMMQQASYEFGFEADDFPLMIEAIPMSSESIVLIITKVDDPEELDTRFSKFAPSFEDEFDDMEELEGYDNTDDLEGADEVLELFSNSNSNETEVNLADFQNVTKIIEDTPEAGKEKEDSDTSENANLVRIYSFHDFKTIESLASILREVYFGKNSLYRNPVSRTYYLILNKSEHTPVQFNQIINIVSEYGNKEAVSMDRELFYQEHYQTILKDSALQILANIL